MTEARADATPGRQPAPRARNPLLTFAALVVVVFGLRELRAALLPVCFGIFLAVLASLPRRWLLRLGVPSGVAAVTLVLLVGGLGWLLFLGLQRTLVEFAAVVPGYRARLEELLADAVAWFASLGIQATPREMVASLEPSTWVAFLGQSVGGALGLVSMALLVLFVLFFALFEVDRIRARLQHHLGSSYDEARLLGVVVDLQRYLGVKTMTSTLTGLLAFAACALFGVAFPGLWGLIAFVLNFVPIVGSILAAVPAVLLALVDPALGWRVALPLALVYVAFNNAISNVLEPLLMGQRIGISPLGVLLGLVFWGWLWGAGGMLLAVPLTLVVDVLLERNRDLAFLAALIGHRPARPSAAGP